MGKYVQNQIEENIHLSEKKQLEHHLAHARSLMVDINALNVDQINIYQNLILIYKACTGTVTSITVTIIRQVPKIVAIIQFLSQQRN